MNANGPATRTASVPSAPGRASVQPAAQAHTDLAIDFHTGTPAWTQPPFTSVTCASGREDHMMLYPFGDLDNPVYLVCCTTPTSMRAFPVLRPRLGVGGGWIST